jgi:hypothetical protein
MKKNVLGRGIEALFPLETKEEGTKKKKDAPKVKTDKVEDISYNLELIRKSTEEASENPRITLWSQPSAAVLRYLKKTIPEFSISNEIKNLLDEVIEKKYPEIWKRVTQLKA